MPPASIHTPTRFTPAWTLGFTADPRRSPKRWVPATVPGNVQLDWARAEGWPPYWQAENFRAYAWMEDVHWVYRTVLEKPRLPVGRRLVLACAGVDYACEVRVDGDPVHAHEGMFSPFTVDLTRARNGARLEIVVAPAPKNGRAGDRTEANQSCKPAVAYGWDFHPRLIPLGLWGDTVLEVRGPGHIEDAEVLVDPSEDLSEALVRLRLEGEPSRVRWTVTKPNGRRAFRIEGTPADLTATLRRPELWWPAGDGPASLYTSRVEILGRAGRVEQAFVSRFGVRCIRLVMAPGQFDRAGGQPASQPPAPMTFEVNGRPVFIRGANWVCPTIFPGTLTREEYALHVGLAAEANLNLLRCWGGAIVNKDPFFDLCEEKGILVWQEFPLACNRYDGTPAYLRTLEQEAAAIVRRLRRRACLAVWCGGNELFNAWSRMTPQDAAIRLLDSVCRQLDPRTPFLPTSPVHGVRHGDYRFRMPAEDKTVFDVYPRLDATAYMEFGVPGPAPAATLRRVIPEAEIWPPKCSGSWLAHHAFRAWHPGEPGSWLYPEVAEHYFGPAANLEELVSRLQLLQAEGYKAIYEEARRQKPVCSGAACWVFNEPWPCAANNSIVAWPGDPKPAYHAVARSCRLTLASARIPAFAWRPGATFSAQLFLLHDGLSALPALRIHARLECGTVRIEAGTWDCPATEPRVHVAGPHVQAPVPDATKPTFDLVLEVEGRPDLGSTYTFAFRR